MRQRGPIRVAAAASALPVGGLVLYAILSLERYTPPRDVAAAVSAAMEDAGATHTVTAVLLQFRGWDTFLEVSVLLVAVVGAMLLADGARPARVPADAPGEVPLTWLVRLVVPALVLAAGHLLLLGSSAPGGAFQAGALLAAAAVLLVVARRAGLDDLPGLALRASWALGAFAFATAGAVSLLRGRLLLELPPHSADRWVLGIEAGVTIAVGAALGSMFSAARRAGANSRVVGVNGGEGDAAANGGT